MSNNKSVPPTVPLGYKFLFGGIANIGATLVTHPLDVIKVRMQLSGEGGGAAEHKNSFRAGVQLFKERALYNGLSASIMRQASYGTTRLGIYTAGMEALKGEDGTPAGFLSKVGVSIIAGGTGAIVGNPFDLSLVRMAADSRLPVEERRNYKSVFDAISTIVKNEGPANLWNGAGPTVTRCIVLNMAQLTTYSQAKEELLATKYFQDDIFCHFTSSMISGLVASLFSTPFDVAKTRIQQQKNNEYKGMFDCLSKTAKAEGVTSLWKGFTATYVRLGPQTVLTFVLLEKVTQTYLKSVEV